MAIRKLQESSAGYLQMCIADCIALLDVFSVNFIGYTLERVEFIRKRNKIITWSSPRYVIFQTNLKIFLLRGSIIYLTLVITPGNPSNLSDQRCKVINPWTTRPCTKSTTCPSPWTRWKDTRPQTG